MGGHLRITLGAYLCVDREKDEDEGVPSETEEDRRQQESRVKEIRGDHPPVVLCCVVLCCVGQVMNPFVFSFQSFYEGKTSRSSLYWRKRSTSSESWATVAPPPRIQTHQSGSGCYSGPHLMMSQRGSQS